MKENVIIGKLIPAGTGMKRYRNIKLDSDIDMQEELSFEDFEMFGDGTFDSSDEEVEFESVNPDEIDVDEISDVLFSQDSEENN